MATYTETFGGTLTNWVNKNTAWGSLSAAGGLGESNISGGYPGHEAAAYYNNTVGNDQYSQCAIIGGYNFLSVAWGVGLICRMSTDADGARDYYYGIIHFDAAGSVTARIGKVVNGTNTSLTSTTTTHTTGDIWRLEVSGTNLTLKRGATTVLTTSDASLASGFVGIYHGTQNVITVDTWEGGDLAAADAVAPTYDSDPAITARTATTATFAATATDAIDTAVDHYIGIYATGNTPTAANIKAGAGTGFVVGASGLNVANGVSSNYGGAISGLSGSVSYDAWATVEEHGATKNLHTPFQVAFITPCALSSPLGAMDATTGPTGNTASGGVTVTGSAGTLYAYLSNSATPPSVADLKSGSGSIDFENQAISSPGAKTFTSLGPLSEKTNYYFHYVVNQNSLDSAISTSAAFQATDAPTLSSATATVASATSAAISVATDRAAVGTCWVAVTTSATKPSAAQIKAGQNHLGAAAAYATSDASVTNPQLFTATGLTTGVGYYAHLYQEDADSDPSNIITTNSFTPTSSGVYNIDGFTPGTIRPGDAVTANISGAWSGVGMGATINGHPVTLSAQSASQVTFTAPTYHTNPTFNDSPYDTPLVFTLNDGANNQAKNLTVRPPTGYDFVSISALSGIFADDIGVAIGDDHLGHWTAGSSDPITTSGILNNIIDYPATYVYWRFDDSEHLWTESATETFYEIVEFDGDDYVDKIYYDNVAISSLDLSASFNETTANITAFAMTGDAVPGLSLNTSTGALTGTPTTPGIYQVTVSATDSDGNVDFSNTFDVTVYGIPVFSSSPSTQTYTDGEEVALSLAGFINADGLSPADIWAQDSGDSLTASGLTLDTNTGMLSGTIEDDASQSSPYEDLVFTAENASGDDATDPFDIIVLPRTPTFPGSIANISISTGAMTPVDVSGEFAGFIDDYDFNGAVPAGISISSVGVISGTPTTFGTFAVTVTATNANGSITSNSFNIIATASGPTFTGNITNKGPYAISVAITPVDVSGEFGGSAATNYILTGGPSGLGISTAGVISGVPTIGGVFTGCRVTKVNDAGSVQSNAFSITVVDAAPALITTPLPNRNNFDNDVVAAINFNLLWTGAASVAVTNLPAGLTDTAGSVAGTVTTPQTKLVEVTATNVVGSSVARFTWVVSPDTPTLTDGLATTGATTATLRATTDVFSGQARYVVTESAVAPDADQVKAGDDENDDPAFKSGFKNLSKAGAFTLPVSGLVPLTTYYGYIVHTYSGNDSNVEETGAFLVAGGGGGNSGSILQPLIIG